MMDDLRLAGFLALVAAAIIAAQLLAERLFG